MGEGEGGRGPARRPMACEYTGEKAVLRLGKEEVPLAEAGRCEVLRVGGPVANEALAELLAPLADLTELVLKRIRHLPRLGHMTRLGRVTVSDSPALTFAESVFAGLGSLTEILVNNTGLAHLPRGALQGLTGLRKLRVVHSSLTAVRASDFKDLERLEALRLEHNQITEVEPGFLRALVDLENLFLKHNGIRDLPAGALAGPTHMDKLHLANNDITAIHRDAFKGMQASKLNLAYNRLETLPSGLLDGLTSLKSVHLRNQDPGLTYLPEDLFISATALDLIILSKNRISKVPNLTGLTHLTMLKMAGNLIRRIDGDTFDGLTSLAIVHFDSQRPGLSSLPVGLFRGNPALTSIRFMANRFTTVPDDLFTGLRGLTRIDFSKNPDFRGFADGAFRDNPQMNKLYLYGTSLSELGPRVLGPMKKVQKLRLENCKITRIAPDTFAGWTELTELNLHGNGLTRLAAGTFKDTSRLTRLLLAGNLLTELGTDVVGHLEAVRTLSLSQREEGSAGVGCLPLASFTKAAEGVAARWAEGCFRADPGMKACLEREWAGAKWEALTAVERRCDGGEVDDLTGGTELGRGEGWVLGDGRWDWKARVRPPQGGSWAMSDFGEAELAFGGLLLCLLVLAARGFRPLGRRRGTGGNRSRGGGVK